MGFWKWCSSDQNSINERRTVMIDVNDVRLRQRMPREEYAYCACFFTLKHFVILEFPMAVR